MTRPPLRRQAHELALQIEAQTLSPAALLLPAQVRQCLRELGRLVEAIAVELTMQSNSSVKVLAGKNKGRAGRVVSPQPYEGDGHKKGQALSVDVELDADDKHPEREVHTFPADQLEPL